MMKEMGRVNPIQVGVNTVCLKMEMLLITLVFTDANNLCLIPISGSRTLFYLE